MADNSKISGGDRARNALITGTAGAYLGSMVLDGKHKIPKALQRLLRTRRRTMTVHGARAGGVAGAVLGATNKGKRSETVDSVATGGDWKFSAFIEDMVFKSLPKEVQGEVTRFVDAKAGTPLVHYGMTVAELIGKADAENLKSARKALGTLRASRAREEVMGKIKGGSKYILLMNDRIVDGHHFLAKAERGAITSSLNVLDLTPARLSTGKTTEFGFLSMRSNPDRGTRATNSDPKKAKWKALIGSVTPDEAKKLEGQHQNAEAKSKTVRDAQLVIGGGLVGQKLVREGRDRLTGRTTLYHGTDKASAKNIQKTGLKSADRAKTHGISDVIMGGGKESFNPFGGNKADMLKKTRKGAFLSHEKGMNGAGQYAAQSAWLKEGGRPLSAEDVKKIMDAKDSGKGMGKAVVTAVRKKLGRDLMPLTHRHKGTVLKYRMPLWRKGLQKNLMPNPEVDQLLDPVASFMLKDRTKVMKNKAPESYRVGSKHYKGMSMKEWKQYIKLHPKRAAAGAGLAVGGAAMLAGSGVYAKKAWKERKARNEKLKEMSARLSLTAFADPSRNRTRDLRDKLGLAKDVGVLGLIGGAGYGGHKLYKQGQKAVTELTPAVRRTLARANVGLRQAGKIGKSWRKAAISTKETLGTVNDAVQPAASMNRGIAKAGRKIAVGAKKIGQIKLWADGRKLTQFETAPKRDKLSRARDIAVLGGAAAATAGAGYLVHQGHKVVKAVAPTVKDMKATTTNVRHATRISADVGRVYGDLTQPLREPKRYQAKVRGAFRRGKRSAAAAPAPGWAQKVVRIGKKIRLLQVGPEGQMKLTQFNIIGAAVGTVAGAMLGGKVRAPLYRTLLKRNPEKPLGKWAKRRARAGAYAVENGMPAIGGAAGGMIGRKQQEMGDLRVLRKFGSSEQQADLHSSRYMDSWDSFIGKSKGYRKKDVNEYHRLRRQLADHESGARKFAPETVSKIHASMKDIEDNPLEATTGQIGRSIMRKANTVRMVSERGGGLAHDAVKHLRGDKREKDAWGREKKREWEKPWFQRKRNQLVAGGAILATGLAYRKFPKLQRGVEGLKIKGKDAVNKVFPDTFPDKGTAHAAAMTGKPQSTSAMIEEEAKALAAKLAKDAKEAKARIKGSKLKVVKPKASRPVKGGDTPSLNLAAYLGKVTRFSDPLDAGWDLRDARGRSARVFAPGSQGRDRRPKEWYEKIDNERKLWAGAALAGTGLSAAVMHKLGGKKLVTATERAVQAERAKIRKALQAVHKKRAAAGGSPPSNIRFMPKPSAGAAA